jgi:hypothetical protein
MRALMSIEDHPTQPPAPRRFFGRGPVLAGTIAAIAVGLLIAVLMTRGDDDVAGALPNEPPALPTTVGTITTVDARTEVVARLREILRIRDRAFHDRNGDLLSDIYTVDCPCMEGDRNAIQDLSSKDYRLIGGQTSIRVHRVDRVNERLWLVIADFRSAPLQIETAGGRLVRQEPAGSELYQFALAKPVGGSQWLLGRATSYRDG